MATALSATSGLMAVRSLSDPWTGRDRVRPGQGRLIQVMGQKCKSAQDVNAMCGIRVGTLTGRVPMCQYRPVVLAEGIDPRFSNQ